MQATSADVGSWDGAQVAGHLLTLLVGWCRMWRSAAVWRRPHILTPAGRAEARAGAKQGRIKDEVVWCALPLSLSAFLAPLPVVPHLLP